MITKEQAVALKVGTILHHDVAKNADGTPLRVRVNGKCRTWKTRPDYFSLPVKHGLRDYGYVDNCHLFNSDMWSVAP